MALPGVAPDAVHVQSEGGTLTIVGRRPLPSCDGNAKIVRLEIPYGSFERRIALQLNRLRLSERELIKRLPRAHLCEAWLSGAHAMNDTTQTSATEQASASELKLPDRALIILPTRNAVLFPGAVAPFALGRPQSIAGAQAAARADKPIGVLLQTDPSIETPGPEHLRRVGTVAEILRYVTAPDGSHHIVTRGTRRFRIAEFLPGYPFLVARVDEIGEAEVYSTEIAARMHQLKERAREAISLLPTIPKELADAIDQIQSPAALADFVANASDLTPAEKQDLLETFDVQERLDKLLRILAQQIEVLRLSKQIGEQTQESLQGRQREHILREQLRQIQKELGEGEGTGAEIAELREAIEKAKMPEEAEKQALKELARLERTPEASAEHSMIRSYLDWLIELPWSKLSEERIDIAEARRILDEDHYGLPKIKQRILEFLAVRKLKPDGKSPILCFVGPPGVGKTSLGQSIARATGRKFARLSLGGLHDEAEIRGHRRTYIGALARQRHPGDPQSRDAEPGADARRDGQARRGLSRRPVRGPARGARSGAELDLPRQLPRCPLRSIAGDVRRHRQCDRHDPRAVARPHGDHRAPRLYRGGEGRDRQALSASSASSRLRVLRPGHARSPMTRSAPIIRDYTREAGVRNLEREIGAICRHVATRVAEGKVEHMQDRA